MQFSVLVDIRLRGGISDPAGATIERALPVLGYEGIAGVTGDNCLDQIEARESRPAVTGRWHAEPIEAHEKHSHRCYPQHRELWNGESEESRAKEDGWHPNYQHNQQDNQQAIARCRGAPPLD